MDEAIVVMDAVLEDSAEYFSGHSVDESMVREYLHPLESQSH